MMLFEMLQTKQKGKPRITVNLKNKFQADFEKASDGVTLCNYAHCNNHKFNM